MLGSSVSKSWDDQPVTVTELIGPWLVEYHWPADADQGGPARITISPHAEAAPADLAGGLSSTVVRQLDFRKAAKEWRRLRRRGEEAVDPARRKLAQRLQGLVSDGITDEYLAALADTYVTLVSEGEASVTTSLAELVGKKPETIKIHLKSARKRGLLTTVKGRAGGNLTDEARRILGR